MTTKKIAFVIDGLQMGGAEKFLIRNVNHFSNNGYFPVVILLSEEKSLIKELDEKVKIFTVLRRFKYDLSVSSRIKRIINEEQINKVFCINTYSFFLTRIAFYFDRGVKFYLSLHTTMPYTRKSYFLNLAYFRLLKKEDHVIYICENQKKYLRKKYHISPHCERLIYNGIDTSYFDPALFETESICNYRSAIGIPAHEQVIVNVARVYPEKGHFYAIDALSVLHEAYGKKAHLLFVGGGEQDYMELLKNYSYQKNLNRYIHFVGNQSDVRRFYFLSDLFTLTSTSVETFSLGALEAMSFGLPCSLTDIGGAQEMTIQGVTGILSEAKNVHSIANSWNSILERRMKGSHIRQYVKEHFSLSQMLNEYYELISTT